MGTYIELFPDGLLIPNLSVSSIPELIQFLADSSEKNLKPTPLTGNFLYICSHQSRDMRCGYCGCFLQASLIFSRSNLDKSFSKQLSKRFASHFRAGLFACWRPRICRYSPFSVLIYRECNCLQESLKFSHPIKNLCSGLVWICGTRECIECFEFFSEYGSKTF